MGVAICYRHKTAVKNRVTHIKTKMAYKTNYQYTKHAMIYCWRCTPPLAPKIVLPFYYQD